MSKVQVSRDGLVMVDGRHIGYVRKIEWPYERNGRVTVVDRWEARQRHEVLVVNHFGFPTFATRREAVAHLAE